MNIKEILKKVSEGTELSTEEKAFLASYDPDAANNGRIPKERLDQEIAKFKAEKERADKLDTDLAELKERLEELENSGKTEAEKAKAAAEKDLNKLKKQVQDLTVERDEAKAELAKSERTAKIAALAAKHKFSNPDYLDFLTASKKIDLDDETAATGFMTELGKTSPELFTSTAKPGGGTKGAGSESSGAQQRIAELLRKPELSTREAGEVIKLQQELAGKDGEGKNSNPTTQGE